MAVVRAKSKNHLYLIIGTAMAVTLGYLWVGPKLVKKGSITSAGPQIPPKAIPAETGIHTAMANAAYRGHAIRNSRIADHFPYRFRISGGV